MNTSYKHSAFLLKKFSGNKEFLAYYLSGYMESEGLNFTELLDWLECDKDQLNELSLCRTPYLGKNFFHEVNQIADFTGVKNYKISQLIKQVDISNQLSQTMLNSEELLMAAREKDKKNSEDAPIE